MATTMSLDLLAPRNHDTHKDPLPGDDEWLLMMTFHKRSVFLFPLVTYSADVANLPDIIKNGRKAKKTGSFSRSRIATRKRI